MKAEQPGEDASTFVVPDAVVEGREISILVRQRR